MNKTLKEVKTVGADLVTWEGILALTSGAAVDAANSSLPAGITVAKTATGEYTLTFDVNYKPLGRVTVQVTTEKAAAAALWGEIKTGYVAATGTIVLRTANGAGAATDAAAATKLHLLLTARRSSQTAGT